MATETITIRGKKYPKPDPNRMKRKQAKKLREVMKGAQSLEGGLENIEAIEAPWDLLACLMPDVPTETIDDLDLGECQDLLSKSGLFEATGEDISVGESSASTSS